MLGKMNSPKVNTCQHCGVSFEINFPHVCTSVVNKSKIAHLQKLPTYFCQNAVCSHMTSKENLCCFSCDIKEQCMNEEDSCYCGGNEEIKEGKVCLSSTTTKP